MFPARLAAPLFLTGLLLPAVLAAQQLQLGVNSSFTAQGFRSQPGRRVTVVCAPVTSPGSLYGDGVYTSDSSICTAAVHTGVLPPGKAGAVTFVVEGAVTKFTGATRNGITSQGSGSFDASFRFDQGGEPGQLDWITTAAAVPDGFSDPVILACPAGGTSGASIFGTDSYTDDCPICLAAVHAGIVTLAAGGRVMVTRTAGLAAYTGSTRNGITSQSFPSWPRSFTVAAAPAAVAVTPASSSAIRTGEVTRTGTATVGRTVPLGGWSADGGFSTLAARAVPVPGWTGDGGFASMNSRDVPLAGWTGDGGYAALAPRTIPLPGWTGAGGFAPMAPRTITLPGWTAAGPRMPRRP